LGAGVLYHFPTLSGTQRYPYRLRIRAFPLFLTHLKAKDFAFFTDIVISSDLFLRVYSVRYLSKPLILIVSSILALLSVEITMASNLRYEAPLAQSTWKTTASPLACRLSHTIDYYGKAEFVRLAGRDIYLSLTIDQGGPRGGKARLVALPSAWQHKLQGHDLGRVKFKGGRDPFRFSRLQVRKILASLEQGLRPALHYHSRQSGVGKVEVVISSVNFRAGMEMFRRCMAGLIPLDYASASNTDILFGNRGAQLDKSSKRRLDAIAMFVEADKDIQQVTLEGYSDNIGSRGSNYELSRDRALAVRKYLIAKGVPANKIEFDYFGEHKPAHSNRTKKGRLLNRRVHVQLIKSF